MRRSHRTAPHKKPSKFRNKQSPTIAERIEQTGGKASGFDYLRLILALLVVCYHSVVTAYGVDAQTAFYASPFGRPFLLVIPMFFALSGFLVAGSLHRSKGLTTFLGLRALRIFPALAVDTIFCALIIGPLLTTLPLTEYFSDPMLHNYFQNILGIIHYQLPGVFQNNPTDQVNGQLWTIPSELECYIVLAVLAVFRIHRRAMLFVALLLAAIALFEIRVLLFDAKPSVIRLLPLYFLSGVAYYLCRERIRWDATLFAVSAALSVLFLMNRSLIYLTPIPLGYATLYLGLLNPHKVALLKSGDYSYGIFLYGWPIQQVLVATTALAHVWYGNILLALPLTCVFAALSWHLVEKRALAKKHLLYRLQARVDGKVTAT